MENRRLILIFILFYVVLVFPQDSYRFVIIGDLTHGAVPGVFPKIRDQTLMLKPAPLFYTNVGDMIQGYEKDTTILEREWTALDSEFAPIKSRFTWRAVPGNHDITFDEALPIYIKRNGPRFYTYDVGPDRFIVLDNSRFEKPARMDTAQLAFLKKTLDAGKKARYLFCFYHKPFYDDTPREPIMDSLHALFKAAGVDYVFNGHYHSYSHGIRDNVHYLVIGSSGGINGSNQLSRGDLFHYGLVDVSPKGVVVRPVTIQGETLSIDWITDSMKIIRSKIEYDLVNSMQFKPVNLTWKDTTLGAGKIEFSAENKTTDTVLITITWDPPTQTAVSPFKMKPGLGELIVPGKAKKTLQFSYNVSGIPIGPRATVKLIRPNDTMTVIRRVLIRKQIVVNKTGGQIMLDGQLNETAWQMTKKNTRQIFGGLNRYKDYDSTWASFVYDKDNLYGGFICHDPAPESLVVQTPMGVRDQCSSTEDVITYFINDPADSETYFMAYFTPAGAIKDVKARYDGSNADDEALAWNGIAEYKVIKTKTGWQGEFRIPWKALGWEKPRAFYFNCKRPSKRLPNREGNVVFQAPFDGGGKTTGASAWIMP